MQDRLFAVLIEKAGIARAELFPQVTLAELGVDSLLLIELGVSFEKEFGVVVDEEELTADHTLSQVLDLLDTKLATAS